MNPIIQTRIETIIKEIEDLKRQIRAREIELRYLMEDNTVDKPVMHIHTRGDAPMNV